MRVLIIANARSGRGKGARTGESARDWLSSREGGGHRVTMHNGGPGADASEIQRAAAESDVVVVAGGDGSVHHAAAMRSGAALYHLPCGNENLFAREFAMTRSLARLSAAVARGKTLRVDIARLETTGAGPSAAGHFVLMASLGPDASVVHRLAKSRTRATGHLAYARPVMEELASPHLPRVSVWVDGRPIVEHRRGMVVVANCRQYALGINPCHRASMMDGELDVLFMPCESSLGVLRWAWRCRRRIAEQAGAVAGRASQVRIVADGAASQVDGEAHALSVREMVCRVERSALKCLDVSGL